MSNSVEMISLRTFTLRTIKGHCVRFEKQKPTQVPAHLVQDAMSQGCAPTSDLDMPSADEVTDNSEAPPSGYEREELIEAALSNIRRENDRDDFTSAGQPNMKRLEKRLGFPVSKHEIIPVWDTLEAAEFGGE